MTDFQPESLESMLEGLGSLLLDLRSDKGLTQREAAKMIGCGQALVTALEKGQNDVKISTLLKFANAYEKELWIVICPPETTTEQDTDETA